MAIPVVNLSASGATPEVNVLVGNANLASYSISMVPPNLDFSQRKEFVEADSPSEVDAAHPLPGEWKNRDGWFVVVVGGIGAVGDSPAFTAKASLGQGNGKAKAMTTSLSKSDGAAQFVSSIQISVQP